MYNIYYIIISENKKEVFKMKTVNRGKLRRLAQKGKLLARCKYHYTDDYIYDNATNFGRMENYFPVFLIPDEGRHEIPEGHVGLYEWYFTCRSGRAWEEEDGTITFCPYSNLSYQLKIKGD